MGVVGYCHHTHATDTGDTTLGPTLVYRTSTTRGRCGHERAINAPNAAPRAPFSPFGCAQASPRFINHHHKKPSAGTAGEVGPRYAKDNLGGLSETCALPVTLPHTRTHTRTHRRSRGLVASVARAFLEHEEVDQECRVYQGRLLLPSGPHREANGIVVHIHHQFATARHHMLQLPDGLV